MPTRPLSRRDFFRGACSTIGYGALLSTIGDLYRLNALAQGSDYRALVCVFLYGGNDANNMVMPRSGADYTLYAGARGGLAIAADQMLPIAPAVSDGRDYGLHPAMPEVQQLFQQGRAAVINNVGPLLAPITKTDWDTGRANVPRNLFSHNDQQVLWQTGVGEDVGTGWGGRSADLLRSLNDANSVSMSISIGGQNTFQVGRQVFQFQISPGGGSSLELYTPGSTTDPASIALDRILAREHANVFENAYRDVMKRVVDAEARLQAALASAPTLATVFPNSGLAQQLQTVAQFIAVRNALGHRRQTYFCAAGGYDTHGDQISNQSGLLSELSGALAAFYAATVELGVAGNVTTFTASDFGRTLVTNGTGSDHGWGSHHIAVGGAVRGGRTYGRFPILAIDGPDDTGDGRWIPSSSVEQYSAPLARWFGVGASDIPTVFPNLSRFDASALDFMM
jgi:uncharacterized protein (DUF1501 family)